MTEIEVLNRDIKALKRLLQIAWEESRDNRSFTPFEYREKRNEMDRVAAELRERLKAFERQSGSAQRRQGPAGQPAARRQLRLLA